MSELRPVERRGCGCFMDSLSELHPCVQHQTTNAGASSLETGVTASAQSLSSLTVTSVSRETPGGTGDTDEASFLTGRQARDRVHAALADIADACRTPAAPLNRMLVLEAVESAGRVISDLGNVVNALEANGPGASVEPPAAVSGLTRFAWLMERRLTADAGDSLNTPKGTLVYWDGGHAESFVTDANKAVQFCRREDALRIAPSRHYAQWGWQVIEHGFVGAAVAGPLTALVERWEHEIEGSDPMAAHIIAIQERIDDLRAALALGVPVRTKNDVLTRIGESDADQPPQHASAEGKG